MGECRGTVVLSSGKNGWTLLMQWTPNSSKSFKDLSDDLQSARKADTSRWVYAPQALRESHQCHPSRHRGHESVNNYSGLVFFQCMQNCLGDQFDANHLHLFNARHRRMNRKSHSYRHLTILHELNCCQKCTLRHPHSKALTLT